MAVIPSILNFGASLGSGLLNFFSNKKANETNVQLTNETNRMNRLIAQESNETAIRLQNEMNAYNSPANQRKMLVDAGYNPNLFTPSGMQQSSLPPIVTPTMERGLVQPFNANPSMQSALLASNSIYTNELTHAQTDVAHSTADKIRTDNELAKDQLSINEYTKINLQDTHNLNEQELSNLKKQGEILGAQLTNLNTQTESIRATINAQKIENKFNSESFQLRFEKLVAELRQTDENAKKLSRENWELVQSYALRMLGLENDVNLKFLNSKIAETNLQFSPALFTLQEQKLYAEIQNLGTVTSGNQYEVANTSQWYNTHKGWNNVRNAMGAIGSLLGGVSSLIKVVK